MADLRRFLLATAVVLAVLAGAYYARGASIRSQLKVGLAIRSLLGATAPALAGSSLGAHFGWRYRPIRRVLGYNGPDLTGRWTGHIRSSYDDFRRRRPVAVEFVHTPFRLTSSYYDENATNVSLLAGVVQDGSEHAHSRIVLVYQNSPHNVRNRELRTHTGALDLILDGDASEIVGTYFNNPADRQTFGQIDLRFEDRKRRGRVQ